MLQSGENAIIDYRLPKETVKNIEDLGFRLFKTTICNDVDIPINGHPDMQVFYLGNEKLIVSPNVYDYYAKIFAKENIEIIKGKTVLTKDYPHNIAYNSALIGKNLFCYKKYTDETILGFAEQNKINIIDVKQGYSNCSICKVSENEIITNDISIYNSAKANNIDVLLIGDKEIFLDGYNNGFIGGCCGKIDDNTLMFYGDITKHSDYSEIFDFCSLYKVKIKTISKDRLTDYGGFIKI